MSLLSSSPNLLSKGKRLLSDSNSQEEARDRISTNSEGITDHWEETAAGPGQRSTLILAESSQAPLERRVIESPSGAVFESYKPFHLQDNNFIVVLELFFLDNTFDEALTCRIGDY